MRRILLCMAMCLLAGVGMAGDKMTPLNVKTGYWEGTTTSVMTGGISLPPEVLAQMSPEQKARVEAAMGQMANGKPRTTTYKSCVTEDDLRKDPFKDKNPNDKMKCDETIIRSTGTDLEVRGKCVAEGMGEGQAHMTFHAPDSEHAIGNGDVTMTMGGRTMHSTLKMKMQWVGATCPKE